jgi:NAD(P)H-quinone oxidoreductase subunit 4L
MYQEDKRAVSTEMSTTVKTESAQVPSAQLFSIAFAACSIVIVVAFIFGLMNGMLELVGLSGYPEIYSFVLIVLLGAFATVVGKAEQSSVLAFGTIASFMVLTLNQDPLIRYLTYAAVLFVIGMYGMVVSRNAVRVLMSIELMLNAVNINLVAFARYVDPIQVRGQIFAVFILTVAAAEAAVGLAIVLAIYRNTSTVDMERFNLLKW